MIGEHFFRRVSDKISLKHPDSFRLFSGAKACGRGIPSMRFRTSPVGWEGHRDALPTVSHHGIAPGAKLLIAFALWRTIMWEECQRGKPIWLCKFWSLMTTP